MTEFIDFFLSIHKLNLQSCWVAVIYSYESHAWLRAHTEEPNIFTIIQQFILFPVKSVIRTGRKP